MNRRAELFEDLESGRKGEILRAAMDVFAENGYDAGSMREIASRVGVSEPALYRHFSGKEAIFISLIRLGARRALEDAFKLVDNVRAETLRSQLVAALADRRRVVRLYAPMLRTVLSAASHHPRILDEYRAAIIVPASEHLAEKAAELDAAYGVPLEAEATRTDRVRALMALFVGYFVSSMALADAPDEAFADSAIRLMGWEGAL